MGIINWVQNRFSAKQEKKRPAAATAATAVSSARNARPPVRESYCRGQAADAREEKSGGGDWGLLSIGTLGNEPAAEGGGARASSSAAQEVSDFTIEEVKKLQDALNKLLRRAKSKSSARGSTAADEENLPLDRFLNCPSSLEVDRRVSLRLQSAADVRGGSRRENGEFSPDTQIILSKARELLVSSDSGTIKHKSFKFLLKKMFVCRGGFSAAPPPTLKDPMESRLEKLFKTMLQKKMNARPSNAASSSRKCYLEDKPMERIRMDRCRHDESEDENGEDIFKWDKTDSDFIVLEV